MENTTLSYCKDIVRKYDYARYLQCAFAPHAYSYYALMAELAHIHDHVSEEMIGHIRYAWWQESMDALAEGKPRGHPVLQALAESGIDNAMLIKLVEAYREAWPNLPEKPAELPMNNLRWIRAGEIIKHHTGAKWWLLMKLLLV